MSPKRDSRASSKNSGSSATRKPQISFVKVGSPSPLSTPSGLDFQKPLATTNDLLVNTLLQQLKIKDEQLARKDEQIAELTRQVGMVVERHNYTPILRRPASPAKEVAEPDNPEELSETPVYGSEGDKAEQAERDKAARAIDDYIEEELAKIEKEHNPPPPVAVVTPGESVDGTESA
jgi:hypothetical protein